MTSRDFTDPRNMIWFARRLEALLEEAELFPETIGKLQAVVTGAPPQPRKLHRVVFWLPERLVLRVKTRRVHARYCGRTLGLFVDPTDLVVTLAALRAA